MNKHCLDPELAVRMIGDPGALAGVGKIIHHPGSTKKGGAMILGAALKAQWPDRMRDMGWNMIVGTLIVVPAAHYTSRQTAGYRIDQMLAGEDCGIDRQDWEEVKQ